jgi:protein SCO1/2
MAKRTMNKGFLRFFAAVALLAVGACHRSPGEPPLAGARIGGSFVLTDQDGKRFDSKSLLGRYAIVYFGYTFCPDVCPTDLQKLGAGLRLFESQDAARAAKVAPLFITVDPARDTPAVLKQYVGAFHPRLVGLTGSDAEIAAVAKLYASPFKKADPVPGTNGYLMEHSAAAILFGPDGQPIVLLPVDKDSDPAQVARMLDTWVR